MNNSNTNSGNWNSGNWNSGYWNSGNYNSGFLNTTNTVRIFNKETKIRREDIIFPKYFNFELTEWIFESRMTEKEKEDNPKYIITGGFLKIYTYKEAWRRSWDLADDEDRKKTLDLPNFDNELFEEISGINVLAELSKCKCFNEKGFKFCPLCGNKF